MRAVDPREAIARTIGKPADQLLRSIGPSAAAISAGQVARARHRLGLIIAPSSPPRQALRQLHGRRCLRHDGSISRRAVRCGSHPHGRAHNSAMAIEIRTSSCRTTSTARATSAGATRTGRAMAAGERVERPEDIAGAFARARRHRGRAGGAARVHHPARRRASPIARVAVGQRPPRVMEGASTSAASWGSAADPHRSVRRHGVRGGGHRALRPRLAVDLATWASAQRLLDRVRGLMGATSALIHRRQHFGGGRLAAIGGDLRAGAVDGAAPSRPRHAPLLFATSGCVGARSVRGRGARARYLRVLALACRALMFRRSTR